MLRPERVPVTRPIGGFGLGGVAGGTPLFGGGVTGEGGGGGEVDRGGRLADAALLAGDQEFPHGLLQLVKAPARDNPRRHKERVHTGTTRFVVWAGERILFRARRGLHPLQPILTTQFHSTASMDRFSRRKSVRERRIVGQSLREWLCSRHSRSERPTIVRRR